MMEREQHKRGSERKCERGDETGDKEGEEREKGEGRNAEGDRVG